jgi:hypothetical protein
MSSNNNFKNHEMVYDRVWAKTNELERPLMSCISKHIPWMTRHRAHFLLNGEEPLRPIIGDYVIHQIFKGN